MNQTYTEIIGTTINTSGEFKDFFSKKVFPDNVKLIYRKPNAEIVSVDIHANELNIYNTSVLLDMSGEWFFRWECSGLYASADEFNVIVYKSSIG